MNVLSRWLVCSLLGMGLSTMSDGAVGALPKAAGPMTPAQIDALARRALETFHVPGIAIGIVKDDQLIFARGYGVRTVGGHESVDADTVFAIGSNTKEIGRAHV